MNQIKIERSELVLFDHVSSQGEMWSKNGSRDIIQSISFRDRFDGVPNIMLSITYLDADSSRNLRYELRAINISEESFDIYFHTWMDTRIARIGVQWIAIGNEFDSTRFRLV